MPNPELYERLHRKKAPTGSIRTDARLLSRGLKSRKRSKPGFLDYFSTCLSWTRWIALAVVAAYLVAKYEDELVHYAQFL